MPERQQPTRQQPIIRAATATERATDWLRDLYGALAEQPLGQLSDALGMSDLQGIEQEFADPAARTALKQGMARRRVPLMGAGGRRIKPNSQAGVGTPAENLAKIPRFRSEHGTFVKYEGEWWRLPTSEQGQSVGHVTLERLPKGPPEPGTPLPVLERRTLPVDELIESIRTAKGAAEPKRMVKPRFDE